MATNRKRSKRYQKAAELVDRTKTYGLEEAVGTLKKFPAPKFDPTKSQDNWNAGQLAIAEHLYKNSIVSDPEINAAAMFIKLTTV